LVWILQGDQKVGMNITGWSKMNKKWGAKDKSHKNMPLGVVCCMFLCDLSLAPRF
jgi:hypothetical protein